MAVPEQLLTEEQKQQIKDAKADIAMLRKHLRDAKQAGLEVDNLQEQLTQLAERQKQLEKVYVDNA